MPNRGTTLGSIWTAPFGRVEMPLWPAFYPERRLATPVAWRYGRGRAVVSPLLAAGRPFCPPPFSKHVFGVDLILGSGGLGCGVTGGFAGKSRPGMGGPWPAPGRNSRGRIEERQSRSERPAFFSRGPTQGGSTGHCPPRGRWGPGGLGGPRHPPGRHSGADHPRGDQAAREGSKAKFDWVLEWFAGQEGTPAGPEAFFAVFHPFRPRGRPLRGGGAIFFPGPCANTVCRPAPYPDQDFEGDCP